MITMNQVPMDAIEFFLSKHAEDQDANLGQHPSQSSHKWVWYSQLACRAASRKRTGMNPYSFDCEEWLKHLNELPWQLCSKQVKPPLQVFNNEEIKACGAGEAEGAVGDTEKFVFEPAFLKICETSGNLREVNKTPGTLKTFCKGTVVQKENQRDQLNAIQYEKALDSVEQFQNTL